MSFPADPDNGRRRAELDQISGCDYIEWIYLNNHWHQYGTKETEFLVIIIEPLIHWL